MRWQHEDGKRALHLADDCEERARLPSCVPYARSLFHRTAGDARLAARTLAGQALEMALQSALAAARFAAFINGDECDATAIGSQERGDSAIIPVENNKPVREAVELSTLLSTDQLAELSNVSPRTVRRVIARGLSHGRSGFYRDGWRWYAEREAFESLRGGVSELCPSAMVVPLSRHDKGDHTPPASPRRPQGDQRASEGG